MQRPTPPLPLPPSPLQLTINLVALIVAFVAALSSGETPLNVLQLLWVNLIMDSLAALGAPAAVKATTLCHIGAAAALWLAACTPETQP